MGSAISTSVEEANGDGLWESSVQRPDWGNNIKPKEDLSSGPTSSPPDNTQYVLANQPTGWAALHKVIREFDEEKIRDCKEDIDTLLVFAGLFSAVVAALVAISYPTLLPDTQGAILIAVQQLVHQTSSYTLQSNILSSTIPYPLPQPSLSQPSSIDLLINSLWFASLLISLTAASFGILVKQWLREYLAVTSPSPQARLRLRHLRNPQLEKWKVFEIAAMLPLLLQLSLALFFTGTCLFTRKAHPTLGNVALPLVISWALCFVTVTLMPLFLPRCPYRTALLKILFSKIHGAYRVFLDGAVKRWDRGNTFALPAHPEKSIRCRLRQLFDKMRTSYDEAKAVQRDDKDLEILADADAIQSNDELLKSTIAVVARQVSMESGTPGITMTAFVQRILANRMHTVSNANHGDPRRDLIIDLRSSSLSPGAQAAVLDTIEVYFHNSPLVMDDLGRSDTMVEPHTAGGAVTNSRAKRLEPFLDATFVLALILSLSGRSVQRISSLARVLSSADMANHIHYTLFEHNDGWHGVQPTNLLNGLWNLRGYLPSSAKPLRLVQLVLTWEVPLGRTSSDWQLMEVRERASEARHTVSLWPWINLRGPMRVEVLNFLLRHLGDLVMRSTAPVHQGNSRGPGDVETPIAELITAAFYIFRHGVKEDALHGVVHLWRSGLMTLLSGSVVHVSALATAVVYAPELDDMLFLLGRESQVWITAHSYALELQAVGQWKLIVKKQLSLSVSPLNNIVINLRLLLFSIHLTAVLYERSGTVDRPSAEWMGVFDILVDHLKRFEDDEQNGSSWRRELQAREITHLATVCLAVLRHEEVVAQLYRKLPGQDMSKAQLPGSSEVLNMVRNWEESDRTPDADYIFPAALIEQLKNFSVSDEQDKLLSIPSPLRADSDHLHNRCVCRGILCHRIVILKGRL